MSGGPTATAFAAPFGAAVTGIDWQGGLDADALRSAFLEFGMLCLKDAPRAPAAFLAAAQVFGAAQPQLIRSKHHPATDLISVHDSTRKPDEATIDATARRAASWHTDDSYFAEPAKATMLHGIAIPSAGGGTEFTDMAAAYDALDDATKECIDGLRAVHGYDTPRATQRAEARTAEEAAETPDVVHPLVRTHDETGRKALYINPNRLDRIEGLERAESDDRLDRLAAHADDPRFQYLHVWSPGDIIIWDNRRLMHRVHLDHPMGETRTLHRILLKGPRPA